MMISSSQENQNGLSCNYPSSSTSHSSSSSRFPSSNSFQSPSMGMVYPDMGSLSLASNKRMESGSTTSWTFPFMRECLISRSFHEEQQQPNNNIEDDRVSDCSDIDIGVAGENSTEKINASSFNEENNPNENPGSSKEGDSSGGGQSNNKLCARGHWRPAEDSKLKELVALYGPQNWNLIAEKLEGRSGLKRKKKLLQNNITK